MCFQTEAETERLLLTEEFRRMFLLLATVYVSVVASQRERERDGGGERERLRDRENTSSKKYLFWVLTGKNVKCYDQF